MRALKALVIAMGILLLAGSAVVAVTIVSRLKGAPDRTQQIAKLPLLAKVALPAGTRVDGVTALGELLAVHVSAPDGDSILVVDPATGAILETIELKPAGP
jgi:hypothetical protein